MASIYCNVFRIILLFVFILLFCPLQSVKFNHTNQHEDETDNMKHIRSFLKKINKPAVKTIQSSDGDIIDCVLSHQQLAFDHPRLKGQKPLDPPERLRGHTLTTGTHEENFQIFTTTNESCPQGTIPIRRTTEQDILRVGSVERFGRKITTSNVQDLAQERAIGTIRGGEYYGATATINVWAPPIAQPDEQTQSQMWILGGSHKEDLNSIEVGWQIYPTIYGDQSPRFFTYWTADAYLKTGCYDLRCPGFVQTNKEIVLGSKLNGSSYNGYQTEIFVYVWKDPLTRAWWLQFGNGNIIGYWSSTLFTHLDDDPSTQIDFGGKVVNFKTSGHTRTGMGSGHFATEGHQKAAYFKDINLEDSNHILTPVQDIYVYSEAPKCYSIKKGNTSEWGVHFYYGGPGKNPQCP